MCLSVKVHELDDVIDKLTILPIHQFTNKGSEVLLFKIQGISSRYSHNCFL
jgi:hypothetical protein